MAPLDLLLAVAVLGWWWLTMDRLIATKQEQVFVYRASTALVLMVYAFVDLAFATC